MPEQPSPQPVKSAKDAINAMYVADAKKLPQPAQPKNPIRAPRPAKAATKAAPRVGAAKVSVRPSASSLLQPDSAARPEVRTSLKLTPKKPAIVRAPRLPATSRKTMDLRPAKGNTQLAISAIKKAASAATASTTRKKTPSDTSVKVITHPTTTPQPISRPASKGVRRMDDIRRPAPVTNPQTPTQPPAAETLQTVAERMNRSEKKSRLRPLDSIKNRFRPAPKGFSAHEADQIRPLKAQDYNNPDFAPAAAPERETVHLYGMTEGPDTFASAPDLIEPDQVSTDDASLGIIEDYQPIRPDDTANVESPQPTAKASAPDNNRYALGGQSPFFLKSVNVEKRPLSDAPVVHRTSEPGFHSAQNLSEPASPKNSYAKKPKKHSKSKTIQPSKPSDSALNARPTVIVPARRRSHAPLFALLIVTVLLGAVVGAAVYLFLFQ